MYPLELLRLFPPFPKTNMIFVAMSFDDEFKPRWENVLEPAAKEIIVNDEKLFSHRVDLSDKNDAILTEIVRNISECKLFIADISTVGYLPINATQNKPIRNSNVLYEIGLAHASRLPEEVILLRSDDDQLDFDISGVRVHKYNPNNVKESIELVKKLILSALKSIDDRKRISVENTSKLLDVTMYYLLHIAIQDIAHPTGDNSGGLLRAADHVLAINRMLTLGLLETSFKELTPENVNTHLSDSATYRITPFGRAVLSRVREKNNFSDAITKFLESDEGRKVLAK